MSDPIPMLPGHTLSDGALLRLALYGLTCALGIVNKTDTKWMRNVIAEAGIDSAEFKTRMELNEIATRRPSVEMMDELKACGLV